MAQRAQLFVAEAGRAPRGATRLAAVDWSSGQARGGGAEARSGAGGPRAGRRDVQARPPAEGGRAHRTLAPRRRAGDRARRLASVAAELPERGRRRARGRSPRAPARALRATSSSHRPAPVARRAPPCRVATSAQPPLPPHRTFLSALGRAHPRRARRRQERRADVSRRPAARPLAAREEPRRRARHRARSTRTPRARRTSSSTPRTWRPTSRRRATRPSSKSSTPPAATCGSRAGAPPGSWSWTARRSSSCAGKTTPARPARARDGVTVRAGCGPSWHPPQFAGDAKFHGRIRRLARASLRPHRPCAPPLSSSSRA